MKVGCCNIGYPSENNDKLKSRDISFVRKIYIHCLMPCSAEIFKTIGQVQNQFWANQISRDVSLRWISEGRCIFCRNSTRGPFSIYVFPSVSLGGKTPHMYRKVSNIRGTKSQNLNASRLNL